MRRKQAWTIEVRKIQKFPSNQQEQDFLLVVRSECERWQLRLCLQFRSSLGVLSKLRGELAMNVLAPCVQRNCCKGNSWCRNILWCESSSFVINSWSEHKHYFHLHYIIVDKYSIIGKPKVRTMGPLLLLCTPAGVQTSAAPWTYKRVGRYSHKYLRVEN